MRTLLVILVLFVASSTNCTYSQQIYKRALGAMGSRFDITVVAKNEIVANTHIDNAIAEIKRIEELISSWDPNSQTSLINANAGVQAVKVDQELFDLIQRAVSISQLTDGAFDISYASMDHIWKFDGSMKQMPKKEDIQMSVAKVGYQNIRLDTQKSKVFLTLKGMKIGFGAIGKGYAADKAKAFLIKKGVKSGIINASGDMNTWGKQPDGSDWKVAITNPINKNNAFALLPVVNKAVVTSGNYEKFVFLDGKRFSHIIDPRTGYPSQGIASATVFAPKAELADALATSIFVMGVEVGMNRINQLQGIECIIVDDKGDIHASNNIKIDSSQ